MAKITGHIIKEKYAPGKRYDSFYEEQKNDRKVSKEYITRALGTVCYIDKKSGDLCAKETMLLR